MSRIEEIKADMASKGIYPAGEIQLRSDRMERIPARNGKKGNRDIFLRYDPVHDSVLYGDWREGGHYYTYRFRYDYNSPKSAFDLLPFFMRKKKNQEAHSGFMKAYFEYVYKFNAPAIRLHPYLERKNVLPHGLRQSQDGLLIIPVHDSSSDITGIQLIAADGSKHFMPGSRLKGGYFIIEGTKKGIIFIAEGFATGASITEQTGMTTYIAFSAGNLEEVARLVREAHPEERKIIIADNDSSGTGQKMARKAAEAAGILYIVIPVEGFDANDYVNNGGDIASLVEKEEVSQE